MYSPLTPTDIKQVNKMKILKYIIEQERTTKPEISRKLGISKPTVSNLVDELLEEDLVVNLGIGDSTEQGGKPPLLFAFHSEGRGIIAVHVGANGIEGALIDMKANIIERLVTGIAESFEKEDILTECLTIISTLIEKSKSMNIPILGIGISSLGLVDTNEGKIINSVHYEKLNNYNLGELISHEFPYPVYIGNECQNLALAEKYFGLGKEADTFVSVLTDTGIGAGIIIENKILRGMDHSFGEIGHTTIQFDGPVCYCGNRGCWEMYASSKALLLNIKDHLQETKILKSIIPDSRNMDVSHLVEAINAGDELVEQIAIKKLGKYLGIGLVNVVNAFNPEYIILSGDITKLGEKLRIEVENWVNQYALPTAAKRTKIKFSELGQSAKIIGAGALVLSELFERPENLFS